MSGIGEIASLANNVIDKLWPDKTEAERAQMAAAMQIIQGQLDVNKVEAGNTNVFVSGWRPMCGWACALGFSVQFVIGPLAEWVALLCGHMVKFPQMDTATLMPLLFGMLGMGGIRAAEKIKGVASK